MTDKEKNGYFNGKVPAWRVDIVRLEGRIKGLESQLEEKTKGLREHNDDLKEDIKSLNLRIWGALVGLVLLLGERLLQQLDSSSVEMGTAAVTTLVGVF